jgi:hypothetical protein
LARITALQSRSENCPNALGTAELLPIALTSKQKPYTYVSTIGVGDQVEPSKFVEEADIRVISPTRRINDNYATSDCCKPPHAQVRQARPGARPCLGPNRLGLVASPRY